MDARLRGEVPGYGDDIRLGTAVSVSGAAASPNAGYHSSPLVTILMTVLNARLGLWFGNPARTAWRRSGPGFAFYLFDELFGRTTSKGKYVYLSDGGHFENLGAYELVRRRCRYIVVCDAGADPGLSFWDLGSLVRKCRQDFGIRIEIDISPLLEEGGHALREVALRRGADPLRGRRRRGPPGHAHLHQAVIDRRRAVGCAQLRRRPPDVPARVDGQPVLQRVAV